MGSRSRWGSASLAAQTAQMGGENCADNCRERGCKGVAGNGWGDWSSASVAARTAADGKWVGRIARTAADGVGAREKWVRRRSRWRSASLAAQTAADGKCDGKWVGRIARTAADGVGVREWLEMGGEKKPLGMSELGCANGCGQQMAGENCADGCGRHRCEGVAGNGWGEEAAGDEQAWLRGWLWTANAWGEEAAGDHQRAGMRGGLRTAWLQGRDGMGGREWLEMGGEKKPLGMSELGCADGCGRRGCKEWLEMGREKKTLGMSELGCADGCGRRGCKGVVGNGGEKKPLGMSELCCADGCGRRGCKGVAGNGWGEEAGDERAWLRRRLRTAWLQVSGWKWAGERAWKMVACRLAMCAYI